MTPFRAPTRTLGNLDAETAATLIAAAADIALILDRSGMISDVAFHSETLARDLPPPSQWLDRRWSELVTSESRPKVERLLAEAGSKGAPKWRHLNHPVPGGADIPVLYSAVQAGKGGRVVAFGRDLRALSDLQQRLVDAQQSMERDYSRVRHVETRYRLLFQMASDAIMVLDAADLKVLEANPAARALFAATSRVPDLVDLFSGDGVASIQALLAMVRAAGRPDDVRARLTEGDREVLVSASLFREEQAQMFLLRISALPAEAGAPPVAKLKAKLLKLVESAPDGFVVTGADGRIITVNAAFVDLVQVASEDHARGEQLDRWIGRPGIDLEVLMANLRKRGSVRLFATSARAEFGAPEDVEISAVQVMNGGMPCFGFSIRAVGRRLAGEAPSNAPQPRSVEQLTELIGRVALKDLVREATDMIEKLCIQTALELTRDNRASAAEMLGLSRQSLYVKLRRYGLGDIAAEGAG